MKTILDKSIQYMPAVPMFSVGAHTMGILPMHGVALQVAIFLLGIAILKIAKGHSLLFAFQTMTGVASRRQNEVLKGHVAAPLRSQIEKGNFNFELKTTMENAAVGFVDMVSSATIANRVGLDNDFQVKKEFLKVATQRAKEYNIVILNHTGDGFLFLANHDQSPEWKRNLVSFYVALTSDYKTILSSLYVKTGKRIDSGLRFGVANGSVMLGCLGSSPAHYTAIGTAVNLAARMCSLAESNEIVFSESAWGQMKSQFVRGARRVKSYNLKGFDREMMGMHVSRDCFSAA